MGVFEIFEQTGVCEILEQKKGVCEILEQKTGVCEILNRGGL